MMILIALAVVSGLHGYLGYVFIVRTQLPQPWFWLGWLVVGIGFAAAFASLWASRQKKTVFTRTLKLAGYLWMGVFELLVGYAAVLDLISLAIRVFVPWTHEHRLEFARTEAWMLLGLIAVTLPYGVWRARRTPPVLRRDIPVKGLSPALEGFRIAFVSDLHVGDTLMGPWLQKVVDRINALDPDVTTIGGDLVEGTVHAVGSAIDPLAGLRAKHGVFYVTGNHEYYHGGPAWEDKVRSMGIHTLRNEHRVLEHNGAPLVMAGVPDLQGKSFHPDHECLPAKAFAGAPKGVPRVLIAHQPRVAPLAAGHDVSLQLSGHTHGGQMFPFMFFVRMQQPVVAGFHVVDGVPVYTGRGTGYWGPPIRIGAPPEITLLTLRAA